MASATSYKAVGDGLHNGYMYQPVLTANRIRCKLCVQGLQFVLQKHQRIGPFITGLPAVE